MARGETYEEFVDKFKPKKTTDDCYTPPLVYDAIADWVANEYKLDRNCFARPFYPGGDYERFDYGDAVVVDNPPFSIITKIVDFYIKNGIRFFIFAPNLTLFSALKDRNCTALVVGYHIVYDNGANVCTSFLTNLEPHDLRYRTAPTLYQAIKKAAEQIAKGTKKELPKYSYPPAVASAAHLYQYAKYGIEFRATRAESAYVSRLDAQAPSKKTIFGCGYLLSDRLAAEREKAEREKAEREKAEREKAEREKAEREKAERWQLSARELEIIRRLSGGEE